jgi:cephalosporin hydroxylase
MSKIKKYYREIMIYAKNPSDISDHLITIFSESLQMKPKLIVELGVRSGSSTFVLERVAKITNAKLVSVDIEDCSRISKYPRWYFIQKDDIQFAQEFRAWSLQNNISPQIDLLFIDTSHYYKHTVAEIYCWFPHLADHAKVMFHDTFMQNRFYRRDGSTGTGWDNQRGVIRALENFFNKTFDESVDFYEQIENWKIKHFHFCNGLTILEKKNSSL